MNAIHQFKSTIRVMISTMILIFVLYPFFPHDSVGTTLAQAPIALECGESIESVFTGDGQIHSYTVNARPGMKLIVYAEVRIGNYEVLTIDTGLWAPNGFEINQLYYYDDEPTRTIITDWLSIEGTYDGMCQGDWTTRHEKLLSKVSA